MMPVSDLDRSIDFYTRLLGMDVQRIRPVPDKSERVGYLGYGSEDEFPGLELIESGGAGHVKKIPKWHGHVALYVSDLYTLGEKLQAAGVKFILARNLIAPAAKTTLRSFKTPTATSSSSPSGIPKAARR